MQKTIGEMERKQEAWIAAGCCYSLPSVLRPPGGFHSTCFLFYFSSLETKFFQV